MTTVINGPVVPWLQALADDLDRKFRISHISTYEGHDPDREHAIDVFPANKSEGDRIAEYAADLGIFKFFGVRYMIWYQRIWNPSIGTYWRDMEDRGSPTANHKNHLHFTAELTHANVPPAPIPVPEEEMALRPETEDAIIQVSDVINRFMRGVSVGFGQDDDAYSGATILGKFIGGAIQEQD